VKARRISPAHYRLIDHTADIGLEVTGESRADLFAVAAAALGDLIYDPLGVTESETRQVQLEAATAEELLVRWLNELLYLREAEEFLWRTVEVEIPDECRLRAVLHGEPFDPARHVPRGGLKAATYHQLRISRDGESWSARIILDA
jgi:protein archease